jgi:hypothetical protein
VSGNDRDEESAQGRDFGSPLMSVMSEEIIHTNSQIKSSVVSAMYPYFIASVWKNLGEEMIQIEFLIRWKQFKTSNLLMPKAA